MTPFQRTLATLCRRAGATMVHVDCPGPIAPDALVPAIGEEHMAQLRLRHEAQVIMEGGATEARVRGHLAMLRAVKALAEAGTVECGVTCFDGAGRIATWRNDAPYAIAGIDDEGETGR